MNLENVKFIILLRERSTAGRVDGSFRLRPVSVPKGSWLMNILWNAVFQMGMKGGTRAPKSALI